jgi:hypothetical protein
MYGYGYGWYEGPAHARTWWKKDEDVDVDNRGAVAIYYV